MPLSPGWQGLGFAGFRVGVNCLFMAKTLTMAPLKVRIVELLDNSFWGGGGVCFFPYLRKQKKRLVPKHNATSTSFICEQHRRAQ